MMPMKLEREPNVTKVSAAVLLGQLVLKKMILFRRENPSM